MGEVHLARQRGPSGFEKYVVIKTLLPHLVEERDFVNQFFDEARIAAMLSHPNIVQIFDLGEVSGRHYIAMEHVHGVTLRQLASAAEHAGVTVPMGVRCRIAADAGAALDYAHGACNAQGRPLGLVHRDVSPQNVMVSFSGVVKLVDFGVAKANDKLSRTATGVVKGKLAYMSPEQAGGEPLDRRSDVFALGIVLHELLTGRRLFRRENDQATMLAVRRDPILPPSSIDASVPRALDAIVLKALERDRERRYSTCGRLVTELDAAVRRLRLAATPLHLSALLQSLFPDDSAPDAVGRPPRNQAAGDDDTPGSATTTTEDRGS